MKKSFNVDEMEPISSVAVSLERSLRSPVAKTVLSVSLIALTRVVKFFICHHVNKKIARMREINAPAPV